MLRWFYCGVLLVVSAGWTSGQTPEAAPATETATMLRRLDTAMRDIAALKRTVADQGERITALERTVRALQTGPSAAARTLAAWEGVKLGMSRVQVMEILGEPKFTESVMDRQTLLYGTDVTNPLGRVTIVDDRVTQVEYPRGRVLLAAPAK